MGMKGDFLGARCRYEPRRRDQATDQRLAREAGAATAKYVTAKRPGCGPRGTRAYATTCRAARTQKSGQRRRGLSAASGESPL